MLRRNGSDSSFKSQKIPIRSARPTKQESIIALADRMLKKRYLTVSIGAFHFRRVQDYLQGKHRSRELHMLCEERQYLGHCHSFQQIKSSIRGVITERVEKDYLFGINFHRENYELFEKYVKTQQKLKQRNLYNRYYFSSCPPKISLITQPTATTLKIQETNSTIELQALTKNLEDMLKPNKGHGSQKNVQIYATPQKKLKSDRGDKSKKYLAKTACKEQDVPEESYGLKNYRKCFGLKLKPKCQSKEKESHFTSMKSIKYCVTPQPHASRQKSDNIFQSPSQPRLSERRPVNKLSAQKCKSRSRGAERG